MTLLARIFRFLFWLFVVSWSVWLLRRVFGSMMQNAASMPPQHTNASTPEQIPGASRRLVRDPVCGMHVDETLSIPLRESGELVHFCSLACRDAYVGAARKSATSG